MNKLFCVVCADKHGASFVQIMTAKDQAAAEAQAANNLHDDISFVRYGFFVCNTPDNEVFEET